MAAVDFILESGDPIGKAKAISAMETFIDGIKKDPRFIEYVREELTKFNGKQEVNGVKIELAEVGTKYDYSADPEWTTLEEQIKPLREKQKNIEEKLKKIPTGKMLTDEETGEVIGVGPAKKSTSSYKVTLAK